MNQLGHATALLGTLLSIAPLLIPAIPPPYQILATAIIGGLNTFLHLYAPSPAAKP